MPVPWAELFKDKESAIEAWNKREALADHSLNMLPVALEVLEQVERSSDLWLPYEYDSKHDAEAKALHRMHRRIKEAIAKINNVVVEDSGNGGGEE